jgi:NADH-quinone oxidoreductase subunit H
VDWGYILAKLIVAFVVMNAAMVVVAFLVYFERKTLAHMQARMGPNRAGPVGILQSFADLIKGMKKETTIPAAADKVLFLIAPIVSTALALGALVLIPFGPARTQPGHIDFFGYKVDWFVADVNIGLLLLLALSSLGVYGIIMAAWGSNSKYPLLGGLRVSSQVISYEITLGISLIGVFLLSGSFSLVDISTAQHPALRPEGTPGLPFFLLQPVGLIVFFVSALAESSRIPFDFGEAEAELVAGYHTEYSGVRFLLFQMSEYLAMTTMSALAVVCFFGGWVSPLAWLVDGTNIPFISGLLGSGAHWFFIKLGLFIFVFFWVRWTLPRFRYDQLMGICWKVLLPVTLLNIMLVAVLKLVFFPAGQPVQSDLYWWILAAIELMIAVVVVLALSRLANIGWTGKAERPILVDRQVILVRNTGPGIIEGETREARPTGVATHTPGTT